MTTARQFHLSDILTITTGKLVSTRHIEGVYDILNYMTGRGLMTHELADAMKQCRPLIHAQHPQLAGDEVSLSLVEPPADGDHDGWAKWLAAHVARFGETLPVATLRGDEGDDGPTG